MAKAVVSNVLDVGRNECLVNPQACGKETAACSICLRRDVGLRVDAGGSDGGVKGRAGGKFGELGPGCRRWRRWSWEQRRKGGRLSGEGSAEVRVGPCGGSWLHGHAWDRR